MSQFGRWILGVAVIVLAMLAGCSRPAGLQGDSAEAPADQHQVPFRDGAEAPPSSDPRATTIGRGKGQNPTSNLPFGDAQSLPAGTLVTVRLKDPIAIDKVSASGSFVAVVDEPVTVDGDTLIPQGVSVTGRVESARASEVKRSLAYVRLTLDSIDLAGQDLPVQTSSLFARGNPSETQDDGSRASPTMIHLKRGRRLTFRLSEPVYLASQRAVPAP